MKVFQVQADITKCQIIQRDDREDLHEFKCEKMINIWDMDNWYIYNPLDPKCHFFTTPGATLIFDDFILKSDLGTLLEMSGEILPVKIDRDNYYFLNVTNCINALNNKLTTYHIYPDGTKDRYKDFVFYSYRIGGIPLFKVPETCSNQVLCFEGISDSWDEFKGRYEELGLIGLEFIELYDSEKIAQEA